MEISGSVAHVSCWVPPAQARICLSQESHQMRVLTWAGRTALTHSVRRAEGSGPVTHGSAFKISKAQAPPRTVNKGILGWGGAAALCFLYLGRLGRMAESFCSWALPGFLAVWAAVLWPNDQGPFCKELLPSLWAELSRGPRFKSWLFFLLYHLCVTSSPPGLVPHSCRI